MVEEFLAPGEIEAFKPGDLVKLREVFNALKGDAAYQDEPEKLKRLARTIVALYKAITKEPDKLVEILRDPVE
ncbi:hypothetical protein [Pararhizobium arenae]|uniref:hypothetical protein n=1 Tax=Pararhizobium arenae TaxID=1856850 RepID=UPI00094B623C|nr:hypothetical protein [Pararhizobium arenae]